MAHPVRVFEPPPSTSLEPVVSHRARHRLALPGSPAPRFARPGTSPDYAPDLAWEPVHLALDLTPDAAQRAMAGELVLTAACRDPRSRELVLDAVDLDIAGVESVSGGALTWRNDGTRLHIRWDDSAKRGDERKVRVVWTVERPLSGLVGPALDRTAADGAFLATDHETQRARYWLPCVDHPSVRPSLDIALTVPADHTALSAGAFVSDTPSPDGTTHTVRWHLRDGCPSYLTCIATGQFAESDGGVHTTADGRTVPIALYAPHPLTADDLARSFGPTREMLDWMTGFLDSTFPYPKYFQFAVPGIGGAMENISLVSWDDAWIADARLHEEIGWLIDLINLHEMAHTWFGDVVVCRDHAHSWLKESWATYMESVWLEDTVGTDAMHIQLADERRAYFSEADGNYIRPLATRYFDSAWDLYDRHLYPGGAVRLHLLRHELGDDAFWRGVRSYLARFRNRVVETDDLRRELEAASGRSLASFFDHWVHSPGYPRLTASWSYGLEQREGTLTVSRKSWPKDSGVPDFELPITVAVEQADGVWVRKSARLKGASVRLAFELPKDASQVVVDPDSVLPAKIKLELGADQLMRSVAHCPHIRGRLDAATALGDKASRKGLQAIADAYASEPYWQVRGHLASRLGGAQTHFAASLLAGLLSEETEAPAMHGLLTACGQHRNAALAEAICAWIDAGDRPYRAHGAALLALGKQRDVLHEARLVKASADMSWWGWVARGAVQGLGELRTETATAVVSALATNPATRRPVRISAAEALGKAGRWQPRAQREQVLDTLSDLCGDAEYGVRMGAARGLGQLGESAGAGAVRKLAATGITVQDRPRVEKLAERIGKADSGGIVAALEKKIDSLADQVRKLSERMDSTTSLDTEKSSARK